MRRCGGVVVRVGRLPGCGVIRWLFAGGSFSSGLFLGRLLVRYLAGSFLSGGLFARLLFAGLLLLCADCLFSGLSLLLLLTSFGLFLT